MNKKQQKEKGTELIKTFIYAQYDAFENRRKYEEMGARNHEYYWEAIGVFVCLNVFGLMDVPEFDAIEKECKINVEMNGCKRMYYLHSKYELVDNCLSFQELLDITNQEIIEIPKKESLYTKIKNYVKRNK